MTIKPLHELKGHKAPVLTLDYSDKTFFGDNTLASGSGFFLWCLCIKPTY